MSFDGKIDCSFESVKNLLSKGVSIQQLKKQKELRSKKLLLNKMSFSNVCPKKVRYEHKNFWVGSELNLTRYMGIEYEAHAHDF